MRTKLNEKTHPNSEHLAYNIFIKSPTSNSSDNFTEQKLRFMLFLSQQIVLLSEELETFKIKYEHEKSINEARHNDFAKKHSEDIQALRKEFDAKLTALMQQNQQQLNDVAKRIKTSQDLNDEMLLDACARGDHKKMQLALDLGANPAATDSDGATPFYLCVFNNHYDLASALVLRSKAAIDIPDNDGDTILQMMSVYGEIDAVKFIIDNMPKTDREAKSLLAAYESAQICAADDPDAGGAIKQVIADAILFQAAKQGNLDLAKQAIEKGANKNAQNASHDTPLHAAAYAGHADVVRYLLSLHASIVRCNRNGQTVISVASSQEVKDAISLYQQETAAVVQAKARGFMARSMFAPRLQEHRNKLYADAKNITDKLMGAERFEEVRLLATELEKKQYQKVMEMIQRYNETQVISSANPTETSTPTLSVS